jgi:hypothetical protein
LVVVVLADRYMDRVAHNSLSGFDAVLDYKSVEPRQVCGRKVHAEKVFRDIPTCTQCIVVVVNAVACSVKSLGEKHCRPCWNKRNAAGVEQIHFAQGKRSTIENRNMHRPGG